MSVSFQVVDRDNRTRARSGILGTPHGEIQTPAFLPVGTAGAVKAMPHEWLQKLDARVILANTYHLYLRPGEDVIRKHGGLHRFMSWNRPILTDSGGYQVFSHKALRKMSEAGVEFQSHLDGSRHFISPERSIEIQQTLGADIMMIFDDCTSYPVTEAEARESMSRSLRWAKRCVNAYQDRGQALFGIVQGSVYFQLRKESLEGLCDMDFHGIALGGFSVGEPKLLMYELVERLGIEMPEDKPRYLMGVGTPLDLLHGVKQGMDMFDCVLPTRNARNGTLFTSVGRISIKNARHREDEGPLDPNCSCFVCRSYSRSYLRHLHTSGEILSSVLNTYHNLHFYLDLMGRIRKSIRLNSLSQLEKDIREHYECGAAPVE